MAIEAGSLVVTKPVNGGGVLAEFVIRGAPRLATVRAGAFQPKPAGCRWRDRPHRCRRPVPTRIRFGETRRRRHRPQSKDAKIVVSGGRGMGGPENWHYIEEVRGARCGRGMFASRGRFRLGAVVAQVGLSGTWSRRTCILRWAYRARRSIWQAFPRPNGRRDQ